MALVPIDMPTRTLRLPSRLDGHPLQVAKREGITNTGDFATLSAAIGIATILHRWCPEALWAFLDTPSWLSMTWNVTIPNHRLNQTESIKFEIGRIRSQVTFGRLDRDGLWETMITYDMPVDGGTWTPNAAESMVGENNIEEIAEIERLGREIVREVLLLLEEPSAQKAKYQFFVEAVDVPFDPFEDGLAIDPRWLYESLDLSRCTVCDVQAPVDLTLSRCGRCGTAAYCSSACQRKDWTVHRVVCTMSLEDRGKALHLSSNRGLVNWDWSKDTGTSTGTGTETHPDTTTQDSCD